eukprot:gnl/MRDRNA2_/MRDRNA2_61307_c0_seq1.p1 gnl/MRDRNA2_/MRDRNA2_61307_c0~~gnl/MRDRNA2_/MRDRNA2_61307_c0_seq1.p1  ORF type:complete len:106 (+),score=17.89 gnl/MRDRNA2_/MRDRNA2_61307_c0_seq1:91-408(+)
MGQNCCSSKSQDAASASSELTLPAPSAKTTESVKFADSDKTYEPEIAKSASRADSDKASQEDKLKSRKSVSHVNGARISAWQTKTKMAGMSDFDGTVELETAPDA